MARFNSPKEKTKREVTVNLAGGEAVRQTSKHEIVSILLASFMKDQFYRKAEDTVNVFAELIATSPDKFFVAQASIFARKEFGMRSSTHIAAAEIAKHVKGEAWTRRFISKVVNRPDDMLEIMGYYTAKYGKRPIPNCLKKGMASAFSQFDGYQIAKYKGEGKSIKMIDLVNLIHPVATSKNETALKNLVADALKVSGTWEAKLTEAGQKAETEEHKAELKADAWKELITSKKIGYFALLRNLRNIIAQAPDMVNDACKLLVDENLIRKSLVMPFRFNTAADEIGKIANGTGRQVMSAIEDAIDVSCKNVPKFEGKTLVALDVSGSMRGEPAKIGALFTAILAKSNNADVILFGDQAEYVNYNLKDSVLTIASKFKNRDQGTDFDPIFTIANQAYSRIIILSDMQAWISGRRPERVHAAYKTRFNCDPFIYSFDLAGYGTTQFDGGRIIQISGFSEKILEIMSLCEQDREALIHKIEAIEI
jgi:60 kDa SS-A/Ro ribonucleoprotein